MAPSIGLDFWRTLPVVEWARDAKHRYVAVSRNATEQWFLSAEDIIGRTTSEVYDPEIAAQFDALDDRVFAGERINGSMRVRGKYWLYSMRLEGDVVRGLAVPYDAFTPSSSL